MHMINMYDLKQRDLRISSYEEFPAHAELNEITTTQTRRRYIRTFAARKNYQNRSRSKFAQKKG